jgi:hypothetical protein
VISFEEDRRRREQGYISLGQRIREGLSKIKKSEKLLTTECLYTLHSDALKNFLQN